MRGQPSRLEKTPKMNSGQETPAGQAWALGLSRALFTVGLTLRLLPFFDRRGRLLEQFPTEDGYFMLTMARNIALGRGMSVAGGEMPTNGTQPLATLLWSLPFRAVGGDRLLGVALVLAMEVVISLLVAWAIHRLASRVLTERPWAEGAAWLAAAAWFASPVSLPHSMNCLETGLYTLLAVSVVHLFMDAEIIERPLSIPRALGAGVLLGLAFWARNDAVFLILAVCLTYIAGGWPLERGGMKARLGRTLLFGCTSVLVALPWLLHNYLSFGHLIPVSGRAESLPATFGSNLVGVPTVLTELVTTIAPLPAEIERSPLAAGALTLLLLTLLGLGLRHFGSLKKIEARASMLVGLYTLGFILFYGLYFSAPHFLGQYFQPLAPFFAILWAALLMALSSRLAAQGRAPAAALGALLILSLVVGLNARATGRTAHHPHFQVIRWVEGNVGEDEWVGAIQTGTLGFFHDRTLNLDGKVNLEAYQAHVDGTIGSYIVASPIRYLADWVGMVDYLSHEEVAREFEIVIEDPELNLGVLRRRP